MTKIGIKKAFEKLDMSSQAEMLGELASTFAKCLADIDAQDAQICSARKSEERRASSLADVKARLRERKLRRR